MVLQTFEELLACVFLEESFMCNGAMKVIDHQLENGEDFLLGVPRVVSDSSVLESQKHLRL